VSERIRSLLPGSVRAHRNAALLILARGLPPVILADLLGLHLNTVERWRALAVSSLAAYTVARLASLQTGQRADSTAGVR